MPIATSGRGGGNGAALAEEEGPFLGAQLIALDGDDLGGRGFVTGEADLADGNDRHWHHRRGGREGQIVFLGHALTSAIDIGEILIGDQLGYGLGVTR